MIALFYFHSFIIRFRSVLFWLFFFLIFVLKNPRFFMELSPCWLLKLSWTTVETFFFPAQKYFFSIFFSFLWKNLFVKHVLVFLFLGLDQNITKNFLRMFCTHLLDIFVSLFILYSATRKQYVVELQLYIERLKYTPKFFFFQLLYLFYLITRCANIFCTHSSFIWDNLLHFVFLL